ncbi:MAG: transposase DNA-binding-containing protein [Rhizonema sp. PD38]|nr:transposase DNA-binding-containing protein [Rhizonema sp. PD38]
MAMAANPHANLPDMMQGWNEIRAAYRLFAAITPFPLEEYR